MIYDSSNLFGGFLYSLNGETIKDNMLMLKDIEDAINLIHHNDMCKYCKTLPAYIVLGHAGLHCKCNAEKLCDTKITKQLSKIIRRLVYYENI